MADVGTEVQFVEDREYDTATPEDLLPVLQGNPFQTFAFIVDRASLKSQAFSVLVLDLYAEPGQTFRATPDAMASVHANLSLANMDFEDYADSVDPDGVFR